MQIRITALSNSSFTAVQMPLILPVLHIGMTSI